MPWFTCELCGKNFRKSPSQVKRAIRFCSWSCYRQSFGPAEDRFFKKTSAGANECIVWTGRINPSGYGAFDIDCKGVPAHRYGYELAKGPIPEGLHIDHLCRNRACVNPDHLEAVTIKENILRGEGIGAVNSRKSRCVRGHELTEENTYKWRRGSRVLRQCRKCHNFHSGNHHRKERQNVVAL